MRGDRGTKKNRSTDYKQMILNVYFKLYNADERYVNQFA